MKTKTIVILVLIVLAVVLVIQNSTLVEFRIFFWKIVMSRLIFMVGLLALGFVLGFLVAKLREKT
jgi:uncharacterized integral membrane protein